MNKKARFSAGFFIFKTMSQLFRAVSVFIETWNRSNSLFLRIIPRKTASHFCWKCFKKADDRDENGDF
ncbi:hypothetical protein P8H26_10285 [Pseudochrobactrum sp. sp1633]|uniref:hypothetical protein n=1 Tax=Pseudochrobactrum sp. sp1633 TaxID=3036706 RepID=UPI0025A5AB42|nr:hypothetical protein [Pseudochrobactrum sp. sp1633]MDM8345781.1 hypothetical protein [Pseudochrobactrum sp. sp1633]HWD12485.1 hypothetical protein [Pseudochrobactrum sp.]